MPYDGRNRQPDLSLPDSRLTVRTSTPPTLLVAYRRLMRVRRRQDVLAEVVGEDLILIRHGADVAARLNSTAATAWDALAEWRSAEEIALVLGAGVGKRLGRDVAALVKQLEDLQLVEIKEAE